MIKVKNHLERRTALFCPLKTTENVPATNMKLYSFVQRELSETEKKTIEHFRYYYDNRRCFALLGDYVIAALSNENSGDPEKLKQEALENSAQLLNYPPDFTTYVMDDRFGLVEMNDGIYAVSKEPLSEEEIQADRVEIGTALVTRSFCLEACEAGNVLAIVDEEV